MIKNLSALLLSVLFFNATAATIEIDRTIRTNWETYRFAGVTHADWLYIHPLPNCSVTFDYIGIHFTGAKWKSLHDARKTVTGPTRFDFPKEIQDLLKNGDQYDALQFASTTVCNMTIEAEQIIYTAHARDTLDRNAEVKTRAKVPACSANVSDHVAFELEAGSSSPAKRVVTEVVGEEDCAIGANQPKVSLGAGVKAIYENGTIRVEADSGAEAGQYNGTMTVTISIK